MRSPTSLFPSPHQTNQTKRRHAHTIASGDVRVSVFDRVGRGAFSAAVCIQLVNAAEARLLQSAVFLTILIACSSLSWLHYGCKFTGGCPPMKVCNGVVSEIQPTVNVYGSEYPFLPPAPASCAGDTELFQECMQRDQPWYGFDIFHVVWL